MTVRDPTPSWLKRYLLLSPVIAPAAPLLACLALLTEAVL